MSQDLSSNQSISEVNKSLDDLKSKNIELVNLLSDAKLQLLALKEQVEQLGQPPSGFGIFLDLNQDDADILINGKKMRVIISPEIDKNLLSEDDTSYLNEENENNNE